jgi:hypothetical protein
LDLLLRGESTDVKLLMGTAFAVYSHKTHHIREEGMDKRLRKLRAYFHQHNQDTTPFDVQQNVGLRDMLPRLARTITETRVRLEHLDEIRKYDINFGIMHALFLRLNPNEADLDTTRGNQDLVNWLLAYFYFDLGPRVGNIAHGSGRQVRADERSSNEIMNHQIRVSDTQWTVGANTDGSGHHTTMNGVAFSSWIRTQESSQVICADVKFQTTKTTKAQAKTKGPAERIGQTMGRRTELESESFELLIRFMRWNGIRNGADPLLERRAMPQSGAKVPSTRNARPDELVRVLKDMAVAHGISAHHVSGISFRKGHATTTLTLGAEEQKVMDVAMTTMIARGTKWTNSKTPRKHYIVNLNKRGPFAMLADWEEVVQSSTGFEEWARRQGGADPPPTTDSETGPTASQHTAEQRATPGPDDVR